jgi:hypothetical protein
MFMPSDSTHVCWVDGDVDDCSVARYDPVQQYNNVRNTSQVHLKQEFVDYRPQNLETLESRPEIGGKFWNEVLGKDGDQLDRLCEK